MNLLNLVLLLPLVGFLITIVLPKSNPNLVRLFALVLSLAVFVLSLGLTLPFYQTGNGNWFVTDVPWIQSPEIRYHVGVDGLSIWLVILSTLLTPISILVSWKYIDKRVKEFYAFMLLLEFGLIGVFIAWDLFLFYVFWEICLVPMYFLIGVWGHERRIYAAVKFFLYTMAGSVLMLAAIIFLYNKANTFDYVNLVDLLQRGRLVLTHQEQTLLFLAFFFAFAIKVPLFPLHTWLPDAHVEAPTAGSIMLAAVMLKMGTYSIVRFCLPMFPQAARENAPWIVALALIGIVYGALVALVQPNMKKLVAYSSVSHLGFVILGTFSFNQAALDGAVYQMLNHGISTGALFMLVGFLYERTHTLEIKDYGGVSTPAPWLSTIFLITTLASVGLPTLNNFIGEFLVLQGSAYVSITWTAIAAIGVILSAGYMLWLYQRTFMGETNEHLKGHMHDINPRELAAAIPLVILMVWMGTYTQTFLPSITAANARILEQSKTGVEKRASMDASQVRNRTWLSEGSKPMPDNFMPSTAEMIRFLPEMILTIVGTLIMLLEPFTPEGSKSRLGWVAILGLIAAAWASVVADGNPGPAFQAMLIVDGFATFFRLLVIGVGLLTILASFAYLKREHADSAEYYALILFSIVGQGVMVTSNELIMLFIGLEISSIASYVLAGYLRDDKRNNEAALKYFLLGSFATAFLLYGVAWIYGATGTTNLTEIRRVLSNRDLAPAAGLIGTSVALIFVGLAFKVSAAPFQVWAPDVYQGAPAPVSAFLSAGPKAAAFAIFLRVFLTAFEPVVDKWQPVIWVSALATMIVGNFAALLQTNIKRLLAYSSIAHAGYVMVAIAAHSQIGTAAVMFYMVSYAFMNIGAFAVITHFSREGERWVNTDDMAGLGQRQPATAALLSIFLLSLIGVPLTGGFFGKFYIFKAALDANLVWLTVLGLLNSAVAAYYYLRIIVVMYFKEPGDSMTDLPPLAPGIQAVLWGSAVAILVLGIYPSIILDFAGRSAALIK